MDNSEKLTKPSNEHSNTKKTACYEISQIYSYWNERNHALNSFLPR